MLEAANARQPVPFVFDRTYAQPGHPLQYYCRADHFSYARYGIPAVALSRGEHLDYHQVTDEPQYISYPDLARVSRMVYDAAMSIANADHRPALDVPKPADPHVLSRHDGRGDRAHHGPVESAILLQQLHDDYRSNARVALRDGCP